MVFKAPLFFALIYNAMLAEYGDLKKKIKYARASLCPVLTLIIQGRMKLTQSSLSLIPIQPFLSTSVDPISASIPPSPPFQVWWAQSSKELLGF